MDRHVTAAGQTAPGTLGREGQETLPHRGGGDIGELQMEFSTGTAWVRNVKICSATAPRPGGTEEAGPGWADIAAIVTATKSTKEAIDALWSPLEAEIN